MARAAFPLVKMMPMSLHDALYIKPSRAKKKSRSSAQFQLAHISKKRYSCSAPHHPVIFVANAITMKKIFLAGFVFGLAFGVLHVYFGFRLDAPLYFIMAQADFFIRCVGKNCLPFVWGSIGLSAIVWGLIALGIAKIAQKTPEENQAEKSDI